MRPARRDGKAPTSLNFTRKRSRGSLAGMPRNGTTRNSWRTTRRWRTAKERSRVSSVLTARGRRKSSRPISFVRKTNDQSATCAAGKKWSNYTETNTEWPGKQSRAAKAPAAQYDGPEKRRTGRGQEDRRNPRRDRIRRPTRRGGRQSTDHPDRPERDRYFLPGPQHRQGGQLQLQRSDPPRRLAGRLRRS